MAKKQSNQIVVKQPGVIGGLKWYWWVLIGIAGVFILSSLVATITTAATGGGSPLGNLMTDMSTALLGLAGGLLNLAEKSPFTYILIAAWALPLVGQGASAMYTAYKAHAQDKTTEEVNKEAGVDPESIEKNYERIEKANKNENVTQEDLVNATTMDTIAGLGDQVVQQQTELRNNGAVSTEQANEAIKNTYEKTNEQIKGNEGLEKANEEPLNEQKNIEETPTIPS